MDKKALMTGMAVLLVLLFITGLNELFGGDSWLLWDVPLLSLLAIFTPIYYVVVMLKGSKK